MSLPGRPRPRPTRSTKKGRKSSWFASGRRCRPSRWLPRLPRPRTHQLRPCRAPRRLMDRPPPGGPWRSRPSPASGSVRCPAARCWCAATARWNTTFPQAGSASALSGPQPQVEVEVSADRIVYHWEEQRLILDGHVVATRGPAILRAAHGVLDRRAGTLRLEGGVLAVQGREVVVAEAA